MHRADGSGTTYVWSDYLSKTSPAWREAVGNRQHAPLARRDKALKGNEGVAERVDAHAVFDRLSGIHLRAEERIKLRRREERRRQVRAPRRSTALQRLPDRGAACGTLPRLHCGCSGPRRVPDRFVHLAARFVQDACRARSASGWRRFSTGPFRRDSKNLALWATWRCPRNSRSKSGQLVARFRDGR